MDELIRGDLREIVTVQEEILTVDEIGGDTSVWQDRFTRRAQVKPMKDSETVDAGRTTLLETFMITMRYDTDTASILGENRILWDGRELNIHTGPQNLDMRRRWITVEATAGGAG